MRKYVSILATIGLIASLLGCGAVVGTAVLGGGENPAAVGAVANPNLSGMNGDAAAEDDTANQGSQAGNECTGSVCQVDTPIGRIDDLN